jgi:hypothetical protein
MWCDDFDCDLYKVLPEAREILAPVKDVVLYTHGNESGGKLNHPSVWNDDEGMVAFFGFGEDCAKPARYWTDSPVVRCTFEEAVRDAWVHSIVIRVEHRSIWGSEWRTFEPLMYHHRQQRVLPPDALERAKERVLSPLRVAVRELQAMVAARAGKQP